MLTINYYQRYTSCITCRCKEVAEGEVAAGTAQGKEVWFPVEVPVWIAFVSAGACEGVVASVLPFHQTARVTTVALGGLDTATASELVVWSQGTHGMEAYFRASGAVPSAASKA